MARETAHAYNRHDLQDAGKVLRLKRDAQATISCEDNLKFMRRLPDESMSLVVTSLPTISASHTKT